VLVKAVAITLIPHVFVGCAFHGDPQLAPSPASTLFVIDLDRGVVASTHGMTIKTVAPGRAQSEDDGAVPAPQWKPESGTEKRMNQPSIWTKLKSATQDSILAVAEKLARIRPGFQQRPDSIDEYKNSGPYHRVLTTPGYSYVRATVFLPCDGVHVNPSGETPFVYLGGWGAGDDGTAIDAGFQYSPTYRNYALFIRAQTSRDQGKKQISESPRFVCGHPVKLEFIAYSRTEIHLNATGTTADNKGADIKAANIVHSVLRHGAAYNWPPDGGGRRNGIVLKRMTTIGQDSALDLYLTRTTDAPWYNDGAYFGVTPSHDPLIQWSDMWVGTVDSSGHPANVVRWGYAQTYHSEKPGAIFFPEDRSKVIVRCAPSLECSTEKDGITLQ
jgi:hypothetical protein